MIEAINVNGFAIDEAADLNDKEWLEILKWAKELFGNELREV